MRRVLLESPYKGKDWNETFEKVGYAETCAHDSVLRGEAPYASHLFFTRFLDDKILRERELGIEAGLLWGECAEASVVYIDRGVSDGMKRGIRGARELGRPVEYRSLYVDLLLVEDSLEEEVSVSGGEGETRERTTTIQTYICDQGHYGSSVCGECGHDLGELIPAPSCCPNCKVRLVPTKPTFNQCGSDF